RAAAEGSSGRARARPGAHGRDPRRRGRARDVPARYDGTRTALVRARDREGIPALHAPQLLQGHARRVGALVHHERPRQLQPRAVPRARAPAGVRARGLLAGRARGMSGRAAAVARPLVRRGPGRPPGPSQAADVRARIVAEASRLYAAGGYAGLSFGPLAARVGLTKATVFHYFPTKDALSVAVFDALRARLD